MVRKHLACLFALVALAACGTPNTESSLQQSGATYQLYVALSDHQTTGDADVYRLMAASSSSLDASSVVFCMSTLSACNADANLLRVAGISQEVDGVKVFLSKSPIKISEGLSVTVFAKDTSGQAITQSIKVSSN